MLFFVVAWTPVESGSKGRGRVAACGRGHYGVVSGTAMKDGVQVLDRRLDVVVTEVAIAAAFGSEAAVLLEDAGK